ncbi:hypothetical protein TNCV_1731051 [Trichonephila clavipes]|nr:hypothetical protein TNCV_1731051 [Trichonephila clavipes]
MRKGEWACPVRLKRLASNAAANTDGSTEVDLNCNMTKCTWRKLIRLEVSASFETIICKTFLTDFYLFPDFRKSKDTVGKTGME